MLARLWFLFASGMHAGFKRAMAAPVEVARDQLCSGQARVGRSGIIDEFVTADRDLGLYHCLVDFGRPSRI